MTPSGLVGRSYVHLNYRVITLYGSLPQISSKLRSRRLQFAGHCFRRVEEPIHSVLFFERAGTFRSGGHVRMTYVKSLLRNSGLSTISDLSQALASRAEWRDMQRCWGRRPTFPLTRRRAEKNTALLESRRHQPTTGLRLN